MLYGFYDESGQHDPKGRLMRLTVGGFIASAKKITQLTLEWNVALNTEAMASFRMTDFASDELSYEQWPDERKWKLNRFVEILCRHVEHFCAYDYTVTYQAAQSDKTFKDTYEKALASIMMDAARVARDSGKRLSLVFAETGEIKSTMICDYFKLVNYNERFLSTYTISLSRDKPALQAAEIVARGWKRKMQDGVVVHSFAEIMKIAKTFDHWPREKGLHNPDGE
jgi:hypothetical protein